MISKQLQEDRKKYIKILDNFYYVQPMDIAFFCYMINKHSKNFINQDIVNAWKRLDKRLQVEEDDEEKGQLSLFW